MKKGRRPPPKARKNMALYAIADTHLSFSADKPMDVFGHRWKNYENKLEWFWKNTVSENDTVVIAGDISWGLTLSEAAVDLRFLSSLPGKKILIKGNHDYWWASLKKIKDFFKAEGIENISLIQNDSIRVEDFTLCGTRGWYSEKPPLPNFNCDNKKIIAREAGRLRMSLEHAKKTCDKDADILVFMHFPPVFGDFVCREIVDVLHSYEIKRCYYGHIHGAYDAPKSFIFEGINFRIISADYLDFRPLHIEKD